MAYTRRNGKETKRPKPSGLYPPLAWPMFEDYARVPIGGGAYGWRPVIRVAGTQAQQTVKHPDPVVQRYFVTIEKARERLYGKEDKSKSFREKLHAPSAAVDAWLEASKSERAQWNPAMSSPWVLAGLGVGGFLLYRFWSKMGVPPMEGDFQPAVEEQVLAAEEEVVAPVSSEGATAPSGATGPTAPGGRTPAGGTVVPFRPRSDFSTIKQRTGASTTSTPTISPQYQIQASLGAAETDEAPMWRKVVIVGAGLLGLFWIATAPGGTTRWGT